MFALIKYLFLLAVSLLLAVAAFIGWPLLTTVTQTNVESRIEFGCMGAMVAREIDNRQPRRRAPAEPITMADCECTASETVRALGLPAATFATEEARAQLVKALGAAVSGAGYSESRAPFMKAIEKLIDQSTKSLAACQKKRLSGN